MQHAHIPSQKVYKEYPPVGNGTGSVLQAFKCLEKPCPESNFVEQIWGGSGHLVLLCSVPSYSEQSCGSILWLCGNASPAHRGQEFPRHANPSCSYCWNTSSSVPGFVLCSSTAPATRGADFTVWSNHVLVQPVPPHIATHTPQPGNTPSVLPSHDTMPFCEEIISRILSNLQ